MMIEPFFQVNNSHMSIFEVTGCVQFDSELHVKLFYKGCSVPLPQWFRQSQDCRLSKKSMLEKETYLLSRDREICITIAMHIHSVIPNATRTLSISVIVIIA